MKRRSFLKESVLAMTSFGLGSWISPTSFRSSYIEKKLEKGASSSEDLKVIELTGTPRQRGQIHGETLRKEIHEVIKLWKDDLYKSHEMDPDKYLDEFIEKTNFSASIKKWTPEMLEEVKGLAEASGIDFKTMFAHQLLDEEWWYGRNRKYDIPVPEGKHCSSLGVYNQDGLPALVAQNMDLMGWTDGFGVLLYIKHQNSSLESFVFTYAGFIATCGMNNKSIGICCNTLLQLNHCPDGLPVAYIVRSVLEQSTYKDAERFINTIRHASGQNYIIGDLKKVASLECSANMVNRFIPYKGANRVFHTNHPLVNDDQSIYKEFLKRLPSEKKPKSLSNSEIRLKALEIRLKNPSKMITVETAKAALSSKDDPDNPVCKYKPKKGKGNGQRSLVMVLSEPPVLHLSPGPPCLTEFKTFKF